ncbi:MAG: sulfotransferase [Pseudomonadota bacterium]
MSEAAAAYGRLDRLLHRLALGSKAVAEMTFDMEQARARPDADAVAGARHVVVAGLARAGTTVLMRRFHASGAFRSLTYRDMPFVLAPGLWRKLSGRGKAGVAAERAHGDGVIVDTESPEGLEEVFWRVFCGDDYLRADSLVPHAVDGETVEAYRKFVGAVLAAGEGAGEGPGRYLAKNNNAILRLDAVAAALPRALIVVPFRDPVDQARSLMSQHRRFTGPEHDDPFTRDYMRWLAHHEFGPGHRPFRMGGAPAAGEAGPETIDYWLGLWIDVYGWLADRLPATAVLSCYETLCDDPAAWARLAERAEVAVEIPGADPFSRRSGSASADGADGALVDRARALYETLRTRAAG